MAIPAGGFTINEFSGPLGTTAPEVILDAPYGSVETAGATGSVTYATDGLRAAYTAESTAAVEYRNLTSAGDPVAQTPTGAGLRFQTEARRVDITLANVFGDWGITVTMGLSSAFWDGPDAVFDLAPFTPTYFSGSLGTWYDVALLDTGYWCLSTGGTTVLEGNVGSRPPGTWYMQASAGKTASVDGGEPGAVQVDAMWLYGIAGAPVCRLYPRDDGRGMSSAPRIWPRPKGTSRIIGGYR